MCKCCNPIISRRPKMLLSVILSVSILGTRLINKLSICDHQLKNKIAFLINLTGKVFLSNKIFWVQTPFIQPNDKY